MTSPAATWAWLDVVGTLIAQARWWDLVVEDRPAAIDPVDEPARTAAAALAEGLLALGVDPSDPDPEPRTTVGVRARALVDALGGGRSPAEPGPGARAAVDRAVDVVVASMHDAGRRAVAAHPPTSGPGRVTALHLSPGGVPKAPVPAVEVRERGCVGDGQAERLHHGRPWQALCLWSADVIADLADEGHPVTPGSCGENVLVAGVDWSEVRPGVQLHLGAEVVAEVAGPADPCRKVATSFTGRRYGRIDHARHPGWSRAYAWVVGEGTVRTGDPATLG